MMYIPIMSDKDTAMMTVRLPGDLKEALDGYLDGAGLKMQAFVAKVLAEKLEELQDVADSVAAIEADEWMTADEFDEAMGL